MNKGKSNLSSYDNVEQLSNFKNENEMENYRKQKLNETKRHLNFIKKKISKKHLEQGINVLELGSGNSKLLYQLSLQDLLNQGYGIEVSKSRFEFAEKWRKDLNITNVKNINANVLDLDLSQFKDIHLFICTDIALQFLEPIRKNSVLNMFQKLKTILDREGYIILELWSMHQVFKNIEVNNGIYKTWTRFEDADPFAYVIEDLQVDDENYVIWNKHFIHKYQSVKEKLETMKNILKPYSPNEISNLLNQAGFKHVEIYKNFECEPFDESIDEYVVLAKM